MKKKIEVENPNNIPVWVIADSIVAISDAMKKLRGTRLTDKAIVALIYDKTKIPKYTIEDVIQELTNLEKTWLKEKGKQKT